MHPSPWFTSIKAIQCICMTITLLSRHWCSSGIMLVWNVRDQGLILHCGIRFCCLGEPTVTFDTQLLDSLTYCLFGQKCEDMFSRGRGHKSHGRQLPWWSSSMMLTWNVRDCGLIPYWDTTVFLSVGTHCYIFDLNIYGIRDPDQEYIFSPK